jgi:hypothetical protein
VTQAEESKSPDSLSFTCPECELQWVVNIIVKAGPDVRIARSSVDPDAHLGHGRMPQ